MGSISVRMINDRSHALRGNASQDASRPGAASGVTRDDASHTSLPLNRDLHLVTIQPHRPDL
ncbi:hypothetical protein, partial [Pseudomonas viridiflava]|uniref:hypothetical protein n=1 Tax=Pseudomonas viridiflava TaxID=33069 RepID=UPI00197FC7E5